ncbi:43144_t:CDS:2 [Gigaspora margarita]|uniref:43144_t:CDS:1 n=1 Tax=Gigaspora margarita TaxID=4874 RepID=A0ABM8W3E8_GIGMA|nr:43144_t:CDS:2 [Gigaspora margarita]
MSFIGAQTASPTVSSFTTSGTLIIATPSTSSSRTTSTTNSASGASGSAASATR